MEWTNKECRDCGHFGDYNFGVCKIRMRDNGFSKYHDACEAFFPLKAFDHARICGETFARKKDEDILALINEPPKSLQVGDRYVVRPHPSSKTGWMFGDGTPCTFDGKEWKEAEEEEEEKTGYESARKRIGGFWEELVDQRAREIKEAREMLDENGRFRYPAVEETEGTPETGPTEEPLQSVDYGSEAFPLKEDEMDEEKMDMHYDVRTGEMYTIIGGQKLTLHGLDSAEAVANTYDKSAKKTTKEPRWCSTCKWFKEWRGKQGDGTCRRPDDKTGMWEQEESVSRKRGRIMAWIKGTCGKAGRFWEAEKE